MSRKNRNAKVPAAGQPQAVRQDEPAGGVEQETAAVVAGDGDPAPAGAEHQGGAAGAAGGPGGSWLGDADIPYAPGGHDAVVQAKEPGRAAQGDGAPADLGDGSALGVPDGWPPEVLDSAKYVEALPETAAIGDQVITYFEGVYAAFTWGGEPAQWIYLAHIGENWNRPPDNDDDTDFGDDDGSFSRALYEDIALSGAFFAMQEAVKPVLFSVAGEHEDLWVYDKLLTIDGMGLLEAARFLREVGHARATVDVVATQLKITGHLPTGRVDGPQRVLLEIFLFTLAAIDGHAKAVAEEKARAAAEASRVAPAPVPIEDTTMEMVDDTMATW